MSRHILMPNLNTFNLIPIDSSLQEQEITIPDGLFVDKGIFDRVQEKEFLKLLLLKISRTPIFRSENGQVKNNNTCMNISFDNGVISCCDNYEKKYDEFYNVLKKYGITF